MVRFTESKSVPNGPETYSGIVRLPEEPSDQKNPRVPKEHLAFFRRRCWEVAKAHLDAGRAPGVWTAGDKRAIGWEIGRQSFGPDEEVRNTSPYEYDSSWGKTTVILTADCKIVEFHWSAEEEYRRETGSIIVQNSYFSERKDSSLAGSGKPFAAHLKMLDDTEYRLL